MTQDQGLRVDKSPKSGGVVWCRRNETDHHHHAHWIHVGSGAVEPPVSNAGTGATSLEDPSVQWCEAPGAGAGVQWCEAPCSSVEVPRFEVSSVCRVWLLWLPNQLETRV